MTRMLSALPANGSEGSFGGSSVGMPTTYSDTSLTVIFDLRSRYTAPAPTARKTNAPVRTSPIARATRCERSARAWCGPPPGLSVAPLRERVSCVARDLARAGGEAGAVFGTVRE
ncbi:Uncharacterised protein [Mycobacteroides abscessus]|nr:Uncharacterised protein [Mycobacteroides abscessus]